MVKYQNGKVYKLLTKIRALLSVHCYLTSIALKLKVGKKQLE